MSNPVAIFFYAPPGQEMRNQGITRLLVNQMRGLADAQGQLEVFTPKWNNRKLAVIAKDQGINLTGIQFRGSRLTLLEYLVVKSGSIFIEKSKRRRGNTSSSRIYLQRHIFSLFILLTPLCFLLPLMLIGLEAFIISLIFLASTFPLIRILRKIKSLLFRIIQKLASEIIEDQKNMLISQCNETNFIWIAPSPHQNLISRLKSKVILVVPDLVHVEYPFAFSSDVSQGDPGLKNLVSEFKSTLSHASRLITFSSHVKFNQVLPLGTHREDHIRIITNANTQQKVDIQAVQSIIPDSCQSSYFFYPTQVRPYKNLENLIYAIFLLNLKRQKIGLSSIQLFLTAEESQIGTIQNLIRIFEVEDLIKITGKLSGDQMSSFYKNAIAGISPSWHEGGFFYFQISEAWDSNTPCIFSNTAANRELLPETPLAYTFDPGNVQEMVEKMEFVIDNREQVLTMQKQDLAEVFRRTWRDVGSEILELSHEL